MGEENSHSDMLKQFTGIRVMSFSAFRHMWKRVCE